MTRVYNTILIAINATTTEGTDKTRAQPDLRLFRQGPWTPMRPNFPALINRNKIHLHGKVRLPLWKFFYEEEKVQYLAYLFV